MRTRIAALFAAVLGLTACGAPHVENRVVFKKAPLSVSSSNYSKEHPKDWVVVTQTEIGGATTEYCVPKPAWDRYRASDTLNLDDTVICQSNG
jgi:hypothetical protein